MIYNPSNPYDAQSAREYLNMLLRGNDLIEIKKKSPKRSLKQNAYEHLIMGYFGCEYGLSLEEVKVDIFKRECNREIFERERVNKNGQVIKYLRSTADLTTAETTTAIERFRNWAAAVAGIYLPAPNEEQFLAFCEQEMERNKEFI